MLVKNELASYDGGGRGEAIKKGINYMTFLLVLYSYCLNRVLEVIQRSQFIHLQVLTLFTPQHYNICSPRRSLEDFEA